MPDGLATFLIHIFTSSCVNLFITAILQVFGPTEIALPPLQPNTYHFAMERRSARSMLRLPVLPSGGRGEPLQSIRWATDHQVRLCPYCNFVPSYNSVLSSLVVNDSHPFMWEKRKAYTHTGMGAKLKAQKHCSTNEPGNPKDKQVLLHASLLTFHKFHGSSIRAFDHLSTAA